jgi:hypothetical protein
VLVWCPHQYLYGRERATPAAGAASASVMGLERGPTPVGGALQVTAKQTETLKSQRYRLL